MVGDSFECWLSESFQIDWILHLLDNYLSSPRLKRILHTDILKNSKSVQFYLFQTFTLLPHGWRKFWILTLEKFTNWFNSTSFRNLPQFTTAEENFAYWRSRNFHIAYILRLFDKYFTSPWLKKILKIDIINGSRFSQFDILWEDRKVETFCLVKLKVMKLGLIVKIIREFFFNFETFFCFKKGLSKAYGYFSPRILWIHCGWAKQVKDINPF